MEAGDDAVEVHGLKFVGKAQLLGDGFPEFDIKTGKLAVPITSGARLEIFPLASKALTA